MKFSIYHSLQESIIMGTYGGNVVKFIEEVVYKN